MNPILLSGFFGSLTSTIGAIYNCERNIYIQKKKLESDKEKLKETLQHQQEMLERKLEFEDKLADKKNKSEKERDELERVFRKEQQYIQLLFNQKSQSLEHDFQKEKQVQLFHLKQKEKQGALPILQGNWRSTICPYAIDPIIIFDTVVRQNHDNQLYQVRYNPLVALAQKFKKQNDILGNYATVIEAHEGFLSESHARLFVNQEFPNNSVIVVYGDFLGNQFNIHCVTNGVVSNQFEIYDDGALVVKQKSLLYFLLGSISLKDLFSQILSIGAKENDINQVESFELIDLLLDFIANSTIQSLVDSYYGFHPEIPFNPIAGKIARNKNDDLLKRGLATGDYNQMISELEQLGGKILENRNVITKLRKSSLKEKLYKLM